MIGEGYETVKNQDRETFHEQEIDFSLCHFELTRPNGRAAVVYLRRINHKIGHMIGDEFEISDEL